MSLIPQIKQLSRGRPSRIALVKLEDISHAQDRRQGLIHERDANLLYASRSSTPEARAPFLALAADASKKLRAYPGGNRSVRRFAEREADRMRRRLS